MNVMFQCFQCVMLENGKTFCIFIIMLIIIIKCSSCPCALTVERDFWWNDDVKVDFIMLSIAGKMIIIFYKVNDHFFSVLVSSLMLYVLYYCHHHICNHHLFPPEIYFCGPKMFLFKMKIFYCSRPCLLSHNLLLISE